MGPEISEERRAAAVRLVDEIRENHRKLRACARHLFEEMPKPFAGQLLACSHCGGRAEPAAAFNYIRGFIAAGGDPLAVAPWWVQAHETRGLEPAEAR